MNTNEQEIKLKRYKFAIMQTISKEYLDAFSIDFSLHEGFDADIRMRVMCDMYGFEIGNYSYPADWWQAFKLRFFPAWLIKRFPVVYRHLVISAIYPDIKVPKIQGYAPEIQVVGDYYSEKESDD